MSDISIEKDIIPLSKFRESYKNYVSKINSENHSYVLTLNGKAAAVLISPKEYDKLNHNQKVLNLIASRLQEISDNKFVKNEEKMWNELGI